MARTGTAIVLAFAAARSVAFAEPPRANDRVARRLVLGHHELAASITLELDLAKTALGRSGSLAPDVWFGITHRWTIGVIHSNRSVDRIAAGSSVCLRSDDPSCDRRYHNAGVDVRWSVRDGDLAVAAHSRVLVRDVDPTKPAITAGALVRWTRTRFAIASDPYLQLGLANRDRGNRAVAVVPLWFSVQPTCRWLVALHTGIDGELATWRDGWHIPIGWVVEARGPYGFELAIEAGFPSLLGPQNNFKQRAAMITATYRHKPSR